MSGNHDVRVQTGNKELHDLFSLFINAVRKVFTDHRDAIDARWGKIDTIFIIEKGDTVGMTGVARVARKMGLDAVEGVMLNFNLDWETIAVLSGKDGKNKVLVFDEGSAFDPGDLSGVDHVLVFWLVNAGMADPAGAVQVEARFFNAAMEIIGIPLRDCPCGCGRRVTVVRHDHPLARKIITTVLGFDGQYHHAKGKAVKASEVVAIAKDTWGIDGKSWRISSTTAWTPCNGLVLDLDGIKRVENETGVTISQTGNFDGDIIFVDPYSARVVDDIGLPREEPVMPTGKKKQGGTGAW